MERVVGLSLGDVKKTESDKNLEIGRKRERSQRDGEPTKKAKIVVSESNVFCDPSGDGHRGVLEKIQLCPQNSRWEKKEEDDCTSTARPLSKQTDRLQNVARLNSKPGREYDPCTRTTI